MKKLIVLMVVAAVGYIGYLLVEHQELSSYGISEEHPIGEFEKIDAILTSELKLAKFPVSTLNNASIPVTARMYQYSDPKNQYIFLVLLSDEQNNLRGIAGWYHMPTHSPVAFFMQAHWRRTGGPRSPQFTGYTMGRMSKSLVQFTKGEVKGTWERSKDEGVPPGPTYEQIYLRME